MEHIVSSHCRVLRKVTNDSSFSKVVRYLSLPIRVQGACVNTKEERVVAWADGLHNSVDGRGLRELIDSFLLNLESEAPGMFILATQAPASFSHLRAAVIFNGNDDVASCLSPSRLFRISRTFVNTGGILNVQAT
ncbi:hypothetical protein CSKR_201426 [Clonorchis sinensis]|uniref:Uncharacterized protein n=1 Tax=Clonorchis sinensis TaxID=79923 RepID=A0A8T1MQU5_CLOSI|nr:hypothetical protein CSKR_201426 [Clonorchis sinensis]